MTVPVRNQGGYKGSHHDGCVGRALGVCGAHESNNGGGDSGKKKKRRRPRSVASFV